MSATLQQQPQVVDREHEHAEHPVGAVDQGEALLGLELDRRDARRRASASAAGRRTPSASRTSPSPISASAQCASGARSPEQPRLPYSCTIGVMPALSSAASVCGGLEPDAGAAGRQRRQPQQHQRADDLALDLRSGSGGVRPDQRLLQLGAHRRRDVPGRERAEAGRDAVRRSRAPTRAPRRRRARPRSPSTASSAELDRAPWRATATTSSAAKRSDADRDRCCDRVDSMPYEPFALRSAPSADQIRHRPISLVMPRSESRHPRDVAPDAAACRRPGPAATAGAAHAAVPRAASPSRSRSTTSRGRSASRAVRRTTSSTR